MLERYSITVIKVAIANSAQATHSNNSSMKKQNYTQKKARITRANEVVMAEAIPPPIYYF
ncbi:hypothetical protein VcTj87_10730 [Vibrio comitans]